MHCPQLHEIQYLENKNKEGRRKHHKAIGQWRELDPGPEGGSRLRL